LLKRCDSNPLVILVYNIGCDVLNEVSNGLVRHATMKDKIIDLLNLYHLWTCYKLKENNSMYSCFVNHLAVKEDIWLQGLIDSLDVNVSIPVIYCDSHESVSLVRNLVYYERLKAHVG
ncbi:hypothetical protein CR513_59874, partial [Mucuna pruriens]